MLTSMPPTQTPCYLLISFRCHLILWKPASLGSIFFSRTALPDGAFRARELAKATRPLTCTHFDPCQSPQFSLHLGLPCHWNCFCHIAQKGRKGYQAARLSTLSKQKYESSHRRIPPLIIAQMSYKSPFPSFNDDCIADQPRQPRRVIFPFPENIGFLWIVRRFLYYPLNEKTMICKTIQIS